MRDPAEPFVKRGSLTAHVSWLMLAKTLSFVIILALPLVLVRRLSQTHFGLYKQIFLVINSAVVVLQLGFGMSAYYFLPREPEHGRETVINVLLFNLTTGGLAALALYLRPQLLGDIFGQAGLETYGHLVGLVIMLWTFSAFFEIAPIANQEIKLASTVIVLVQLSRTVFYLAAVLIFGTVRALVYAAVLQGVLQSLVLLGYLRSRFPGFWRCFDLGMLRRQLSYALPVGFGALLVNVETDLHNYFVSHRFGPAVYAIYANGTMQLPFVNLLQEATNAVMILRVTVLQQCNERAEILRLTAAAMRKLAAVYFPAFALFFIFRHEVITFLFTARYAASADIFAVNLLMLPMAALLYDPVFRAYANERFFLLRLRLILCPVMAVALYFAIRRFGLMGAVSVVVVTVATERLITAGRMCRILGARWSDIALLKDVGKVAMAAAMAGGVSAIVRSVLVPLRPFYMLAAGGVVFGIVYAAAVLALQVATVEEKKLIRGKITAVWQRAAAAR